MLWRKVNAQANAARLVEGPRPRESHSYSKKAEAPNVITIQLGGVTITATFPRCSPVCGRQREVVPVRLRGIKECEGEDDANSPTPGRRCKRRVKCLDSPGSGGRPGYSLDALWDVGTMSTQFRAGLEINLKT